MSRTHRPSQNSESFVRLLGNIQMVEGVVSLSLFISTFLAPFVVPKYAAMANTSRNYPFVVVCVPEIAAVTTLGSLPGE